MSGVRQRREFGSWATGALGWIVPAPGLRRMGQWVLAFAVGIVSVASNFCLVAIVLAAALAWRLGTGPLDLSPLLPLIALPPGLQVGGASLRWTDLDRQALTLAVIDATGPGGRVAAAEFVLALPALVHGRAEPVDVAVTGPRLSLVRDAAGVHVAGMQPGEGAPASIPASLSALRHVRVTDAAVTVDDAEAGPVTIKGDAEATRDDAGVSGRATLQLTERGTTADVTATARTTDRATEIELTAPPTELAPLLATVPHLAGTTGRIGVHLTATLNPALMPVAAAMQVTAGPGRLVIDGVPLPFRAIDLDATSAWDDGKLHPAGADGGSRPSRIDGDSRPARADGDLRPSRTDGDLRPSRADGDLRPSRVELRRAIVTVAAASGATTVAQVTAQAARDGDRVTAQGTLALDRMALADVSQFWPKAWEGHARPWIVENITGGTARDGLARFAGGIQTDGSRPALTALNVSLQGDDVTIAWLSPVPPVQHAQATLTMTGPDVIEIRVPTARQGTIPLTNGLIRITGLSVKDQDLSVAADIAGGAVPDILTLLKHPKLELLSKHKLPIERPAGVARGRLEVTLPLEADLQFDQVAIHSAGQLTGLRLGGLVAGRDVDRARLDFDVTQDGLRASGEAQVAGVASRVAVTMDFRPGPPGHVTQTATLNGRASPGQMAAAGLDADPVFVGGSLGILADLIEREGQGTTIEVAADLTQARLHLLGWRKEPGPGARATATVLVKNDRLTGIPTLHAEGAGLLIDGRAEMVGDLPSRLVLSRAHLGPTRAAGVVELPQDAGGTLRAALQGTMLDLSSELSGVGGGGGAAAKPGPFVVDLRFDTIRLAAGSTLLNVGAHAEYDGARLRVLRLQTAGADRVQALIAPSGHGRRLTVRMADGGAVLRGLGMGDSLVGGALAIDGQFDDRQPDSPLDGTLDITDFHVRGAPAIGKLLQALSVYGLPEAMSEPGLKFSRLIAPFVWNGASVYLGESGAYSASLGLTAKGVLNIDRSTIDLAGTVVPLYAINSALGRLPLLGRLFSPEKGGGLFAVSFGLHGPLANPSVAVNPLSAVTPGLARRLFRLFN